MATKTLSPEKRQTAFQPRITSLQETAETIQADALRQARSRLPEFIQEPGLADLLQRYDFFEHFKFALAGRIAETLAAHDEHVQAVYYFDPNLNPDAGTEEYLPLDVSVNLLVLVEAKSAAIELFITALDRALTQQISALPSAVLKEPSSILNAILITEADVAQGRGYAVLLSSMFTKPLRVWSRS